ncbi:MAG: pentapeptide repeat-containing protein [Anaerolineaceae bacterium]|nr:pentapeptide repeat-containing protein [Anaerolineaceae bacterium]
MNEETREQLQQILRALKALDQSVRHAIRADATAGAGAMILRSYSSLQARAAERLPDDFFVCETLRLEPEADIDEQQLVAQVSLACSQLTGYLESLLRARRRTQVDIDLEDIDIGEVSRNLRDTLVTQTRDTIRRAMSDIGIDLETSGSSGRRRRVVIVDADADGDGGDESLAGSDLSGRDLGNENFAGRDLRGADLSGANLHDAVLAGADLRGARLSGAVLRGADLGEAQLASADLTGADVGDANLADADLVEARLKGVNLAGALLTDATLTGSDLSGARLSGADLRAADLSGADLSGASLHRANLREVNLVDANLQSADIRRASFRGADLSGATLPDGQRYQDPADLEQFGAAGGPRSAPLPPR